MFTINIKGKRDPKNIHFVKLEMVFYKRGYARVTKISYQYHRTLLGVESKVTAFRRKRIFRKE